jgi:hypothetical protein
MAQAACGNKPPPNIARRIRMADFAVRITKNTPSWRNRQRRKKALTIFSCSHESQ